MGNHKNQNLKIDLSWIFHKNKWFSVILGVPDFTTQCILCINISVKWIYYCSKLCFFFHKYHLLLNMKKISLSMVFDDLWTLLPSLIYKDLEQISCKVLKLITSHPPDWQVMMLSGFIPSNPILQDCWRNIFDYLVVTMPDKYCYAFLFLDNPNNFFNKKKTCQPHQFSYARCNPTQHEHLYKVSNVR